MKQGARAPRRGRRWADRRAGIRPPQSGPRIRPKSASRETGAGTRRAPRGGSRSRDPYLNAGQILVKYWSNTGKLGPEPVRRRGADPGASLRAARAAKRAENFGPPHARGPPRAGRASTEPPPRLAVERALSERSRSKRAAPSERESAFRLADWHFDQYSSLQSSGLGIVRGFRSGPPDILTSIRIF